MSVRRPVPTTGRESVHQSEANKTAEEIANDHRCVYCHKPGAEGKCLRCGSIRYCNKKCQKAHWKKHKKECGNLKKNFNTQSKSSPYGNPNECFNFATQFHANGDEEQAIMYFKRALDGYKRTIGDKHPHYFQTLYNMGCIHDFKGEYEEAKKCFEETLKGWEEHPDHGKELHRYQDTAGQLARLLRRYFEEDRAILLWEELRELRIKEIKKEDKETMLYMYEISLCQLEKGDLDEALATMKKTYAWQEENLGSEFPHTIETLNGIAMVYHRKKEYAKAVEYFERSLVSHIEVHGFSDKPTNCTADELMACLIESGHDDKRLEELLATHKVLRVLRKPTRYYELGCKCNKKILGSEGADKTKKDIPALEKGIRYLELAVKYFLLQTASDSKEVIASEFELANTHYTVGKLMMQHDCNVGNGHEWSRALNHFESALRGFRTDADTNTRFHMLKPYQHVLLRSNRVECRQGVADCLMMTGNVPLALEKYNSTLSFYETLGPDIHVPLLKMLSAGFMVCHAITDGWPAWCDLIRPNKHLIDAKPVPHNPEADPPYTSTNIRPMEDLLRQYPEEIVKATIKLGLILKVDRYEIADFVKEVGGDDMVVEVIDDKPSED
mmetsp:Transcript_29169/g.55092  ORF Transcript_29169/g.55092 Transcript_29169/m.55092 type:complete len:613 (+) Transcript_29169:241-2079(+)|eukprot:CAMPEP_0182503386 /NCGR_PEP_ID=MMETSP1321-20130603/15217_1 /TAXON_ID=91990 /ORGANISM="Bolidomonas sp., Strain RCC1657" /LENGTH=612 /DNA_ID=CAMNT_0024708543 /DNA_START=170 /DNA_END=2008 /DNA_ORIENTATION=+